MAAQIGYYDTLKSVAGKVFTYLASITLTGTDGKTITCTQDFSIDEAGAMSSKAAIVNTIKGAGALAVLRRIYVFIDNGTTAATIKVSGGSRWNGDTLAEEDNLAKGGDTGNFALNAVGAILSIQNSGVTGDVVAVVAASLGQNATGTALTVDGYGETDILLGFRNATSGADVDITTLVDTGTILVEVAYLTTA